MPRREQRSFCAALQQLVLLLVVGLCCAASGVAGAIDEAAPHSTQEQQLMITQGRDGGAGGSPVVAARAASSAPSDDELHCTEDERLAMHMGADQQVTRSCEPVDCKFKYGDGFIFSEEVSGSSGMAGTDCTDWIPSHL